MAKLGSDKLWMITKKALLIWTGICFIIFGIIGIILPIIPGIVPMIFGIVLVARGSKKFREHHYIKKFLYNLNNLNELKKRKDWVGKISSFL
jgi:uncharacterized membrane protein YbaN (DUF454 family)